MCYDSAWDCPCNYDEATQACTAEELEIGDVLPSHDGRLHVVTRIQERTDDTLSVVVQPGGEKPYGLRVDPEDGFTVVL